MKKLHFLFATTVILTASLVNSLPLNAQTTVQIGSGTSVSLSTLYSPVYRFSSVSAATNSRSNILYSQSELSNAGITPGSTITSLQFYKVGDSYFTTPANYNMYMANSSDTSLADTTTWAFISSTHALVYSNSSFNVPAAEGWVTWNLTNPFTYTGGSLKIATDLIMMGSGGSAGTTYANGNQGTFQWQYTDSTPTNRIIGASGTSAPASLSGTNSFYLHRANIKITYAAGTLPIKLINLTALQQDDNIIINWTADEETNLSFFGIEKSFDGATFTPIGKIYADKINIANVSYSYADSSNSETNSLGKILYYRLKMVDKDGKFEYSKVVTIKLIKTENQSFLVYPNPVTSIAYVKLVLKEAATIKIVITDLSGRIVLKEQTFILNKGENTIQLPVKNLLKGSYFLKALLNQKAITYKLIK